jgi:monovalent cation:H+ antiporter-2, CPA2 family
MSEELNLVAELGLILFSAGFFTILFRKLKQPIVLGYIVAGFFVGPHLGICPQMVGQEAVTEWSEIGIIFMLFGLGLEFSFKKLLKVGVTAMLIAGIKVVGMFLVGLIAGYLLGFNTMECIFLGGLISMSSASIVLKAYDDMGLKKAPHTQIVFGTLVVEDIMAIVMLVLLSTVAVSNRFDGKEMVWGIGKLVFFLLLWFLVGIYLIPSLLKRAKKYINDEILLIVSTALCFMMVSIATYAGFSSALGAFVMGSLLAETTEGERIEGILKNTKDLFGAIFFVSVGMMLDPVIIAQHWVAVLVITIFAVIGMVFFTTAGVVVAGKGLRNAVNTSFSVAQLGEFAFIIAGLGCSLGVMRDFIYPVVIAVSVITTFTTPYMIKAADPFVDWLEKKIPRNILDKLTPVHSDVKINKEDEGGWKYLWKQYIMRIVFYGIILLAILFASREYTDPFIERMFPNWSALTQDIVVVVITLIVMSPFLYGLGVSRGAKDGKANAIAFELISKKPSNRAPMVSMMLTRAFITIGFVIALFMMHFKLSFWFILLIAISGVEFVLLIKRYAENYSFIEKTFMQNLNARENQEKETSPVTSTVKESFSGYDMVLEAFTISPYSKIAGEKLGEIPFLKECGVNILKIIRGPRNIMIPGKDDNVYPADRLLAVGTKEQVEDFGKALKAAELPDGDGGTEDFKVDKIELKADSFLTGKTLGGLDLRSAGCIVLSVQRGDKFITNPGPDTVFSEGDIVWLAGTTEGCADFNV